MSANHEEINSAIRYWERMLDACCEAGSARDFLAINDLKLFMDELKVSYATIRSLEDDRTDQEEKISSLKKSNMELAIACKEVLRRFKIVTGGDEKAAFDANLIISKLERENVS
jgi:hypothetical protein